MLNLRELVREFSEVLSIRELFVSCDLEAEISAFFELLSPVKPLPTDARRTSLIALVNRKFDINKDQRDALLADCASRGITFNYHEKVRISDAFDTVDRQAFERILSGKAGYSDSDMELFTPVSQECTVAYLHRELAVPTLVRKDSKPRDWSQEILESLLGGFAFSCYPIETVHQAFDPSQAGAPYEPDFWKHIHSRGDRPFSREKSLSYIVAGPERGLNQLAAAIEAEFDSLCNHGHLAIHLIGWRDSGAAIAGKLTAFAEKFRSEPIPSSYFRWRQIEEQTRRYIPYDEMVDLQFEKADIGFHYRDTFILGDTKATDLLVIFQKNVADETLIPCPSCRSHNVQGNSYSSLGVKSWECTNPLCLDRSKFGRGKRYSFLQLMKQQAIEVEENLIQRESVRRWARDVQPIDASHDALLMLTLHYSMAGDGILVVGSSDEAAQHRHVVRELSDDYFARVAHRTDAWDDFEQSAFWSRCAVRAPIGSTKPETKISIETAVALRGNSNNLLYSLEEGSIDGAVTSPPYYNAREYSQWDNIYCYLYDMFNNACGIYRALKPGGYYLFNIFDYFDNENIIALSAMGRRRLILSAYCVTLFERAGFKCIGNVAWDKGDIEGKRGFNGGNFSPFYQAPFNCWEHILVFRKPGSDVELDQPLPAILKAKPVLKMVRGENRHGHTAPFPEALPLLLLERLPGGAVVLDPYGGSMTTGVAAIKTGHRSICIEQSPEYFELGVSRLKEVGQRIPLLI
jgi:DNA modification methylase